MSWIHKLSDTYDNCKELVGKGEMIVDKDGNVKKTITLLPISHSTQNAQIEVVIDESSNFVRARTIEKEDAVTIIPVTEDSATRGNGVLPHPLCDKLKYIAGDYIDYAGKNGDEAYHESYITNLKKWCNSEYSHKSVLIIYKYLKKAKIIKDLIDAKILLLNDDNRLEENIKMSGIVQSEVFIRFRVEILGQGQSAIWLDESIYQKYIDYYLSTRDKVQLCYVSGNKVFCSEKHPAKVRHVADKSKLISANDTEGFTYRGRISDKDKIVSIGYDVSQKAHLALRWLIEKQGDKNGEQVILAWGMNNEELPRVLVDTEEMIFGDENIKEISTESDFAKKMNHAIAGYACKLGNDSNVIIMGLEAATVGRLSITFYREFLGNDFLERIMLWHSTCTWKHSYKQVSDGINEKGKPKYKEVIFIGAPSPWDITIAAYGNMVKENLKKSTVERILHCIIDGTALPYDLVNSVLNRASNPVALDANEKYKDKTLTIACALVRKYRYDKFKEEWKMALDEKQTDRSYIFGRLLAIAQQIEDYALYVAQEKRETNAERLMHQFKIHPYKTWGILTDKLKPYISRLGQKGMYLTDLMAEVNSKLSFESFSSGKKLEDTYILGYYCQREVFIQEKKARIEENNKKKLEKETN